MDYILRPSGHTLTSQDISVTGANVEQEKVKSRKRKSIDPTHNGNGKSKSNETNHNSNNGIPESEYDMKVNIDAPVINGDVTLVGYEVLVKTRLTSATAMGKTLAIYSDKANLTRVFAKLLSFMKDAHATPRLFASIVLDEYLHEMAKNSKPVDEEIVELFKPVLNDALTSPDKLPSFREFVPTLKGLRTQCLQLFQVFREQGKVSGSKIPTLAVLVEGEREAGPDAFGIATAEKVAKDYYDKLLKGMPPIYKMTALQALQDARHRINMAIIEAKSANSARSVGILSSFASASVNLTGLPKKLNPIIRALMDSIKNEESPALQQRTASGITDLIVELNKKGKNGASVKVIKNLCAFLCVDTSEVPEFVPNKNFNDIVLSLRKEDVATDPAELAAAERELTCSPRFLRLRA
ncbi:unnamed protein product [Ambrosiozyma monospora]|uniref:Unnamed protein product n=1 Tax=Ambrosiozyma monospora TaxID=43982 RepID=A0ACB5T746_AMBMO|nr:unnamed protein product [Ambrosiozyma monospora]